MSEQLLTPREWRGVWWHPSDEDAFFTGTLTFVPEVGLNLTVIGVRPDWPESRREGLFPAQSSVSNRWDLLHGMDDDGHPITLIDVVLTRTVGNDVSSQEMIVVQALVGCHLPSVQEAVFDRVTTAVEGLTEFVQVRGPEDAGRVDFDLGDEGGRATLRLAQKRRGTHSHRGFSQSAVKEATFSVLMPRPTAAQQMIEMATGLEGLLSLAYHCPMRMYELRLHLSEQAPLAVDPARSWVTVYQGASAERVIGKRPPHRPLFACDRLPAADVMSRWFSVEHEYRGACQMLLMLLYEPTVFINPRVVMAVTGAEAMQSALVKNGKMEETLLLDADRYQELVDASEGAVPVGERSEVRRLLRPNRAGLEGRLKALMRGDDDQAVGGLVPDLARWAASAATARNKIAHGSVKSVKGIRRLQAIIESCQAVVTLRLMEQLGLSQDELREVVNHSSHLRWVRDLVHEQFPSGNALQ